MLTEEMKTMTEEMKVETPRPKQYLVMVDDMGRALLGRLCPSLMYVEVEGVGLKEQPDYMALVNPLPKPIKTPDDSGLAPEAVCQA